MIPVTPRTFRTGGIVDAEDVNNNLRQFRDDVSAANDLRYTYCAVPIVLDGIANTGTTTQNTINIPVPDTGLNGEVVGVELSVYSASGATWSCALADGVRSATLTLATAGATTEATTVTPAQFILPLTLTFSCSTASTITRGIATVWLRFDRHNQGSARLDYTPTLVSAATSSAGSVLDTELTNYGAAVTRTATTNIKDIRCEVFSIRNSSTTTTWRVPNGGTRTAVKCQCFLVAGVGESVTFAVTSGSTVVNGAGTSSTASGSFTQSSVATDTPTVSATDSVVVLTPAGGTIESAYMFVFWS